MLQTKIISEKMLSFKDQKLIALIGDFGFITASYLEGTVTFAAAALCH